MGGHVHFWSPAGSEAPRRFAFGARASPEPCVTTDARRKSNAPSPLRSAGEFAPKSGALSVELPLYTSNAIR